VLFSEAFAGVGRISHIKVLLKRATMALYWSPTGESAYLYMVKERGVYDGFTVTAMLEAL
jgi:hypothetical protein